jgi:hypothetical protein
MAGMPPAEPKPVLKTWQKIALIGLVLLVAAVLVVSVHAILVNLPVGADFYTFWLASRATFIDGINPYSSTVTLQSQLGIYGREAFAWEDQVAFAYPVYSLFILFPFAQMDYPWAESAWLVIHILILISTIYLAFPKAPKWLGFSFLCFYPVVFGLILGNFAVTIAAILIVFFGFFIVREDSSKIFQVLLGILMAWMTAKPQFVWFFLIFIFLVAIKRKYWFLLASAGGVWVITFFLSFLVVPGWLGEWLGRIREYAGYVQSSPTISNLLAELQNPTLTRWGSWFIAGFCAALSIWLILLWWKNRFPDAKLFLWIGLVTYLFHPHGISYEQLSLLVPLLCWVGSSSKLGWKKNTLFWFLPIILSWLVFVVSKWYIPTADEWPLVYYFFLFIWIILREQSKIVETKKSIS